MKNNFLIALVIGIVALSSCATSKKNYNPDKKFSVPELQSDFGVLRNILETKHPALYWYTPKDSMDMHFNHAFESITDSMTELQFGWKVLAPLTHQIRCGHTSFSMSKKWDKFSRKRKIPSFPLFVKAWSDTMVITGNLNKKDSILKPGMLITSINGYSNREIIRQIFNHLPLDGYADNVNYYRISRSFPIYHRNVFGLFGNYNVGYIDSTGIEKFTLLKMFTPAQDTGKKKKQEKPVVKKRTKKELREMARSLEIDSTGTFAVLTLNTFSKGKGIHLRSFFRQSFRAIRKKNIKNLVLDIRSNGGGDVGMYVLLTKYLRHTPFKVSDSTYSVTKSLKPYSSIITSALLNNLALRFFTKKHKDGYYHFGYWERHYFKPKQNKIYNGQLYVLTSGPTFSAASLLSNTLKGQSNVTLVGEETGGGWHGNSGILIPEIKLPITKLKIRLPLFKLVQFNHVQKDGKGVVPDIILPPNIDAVRKMQDSKLLYIKKLIKEKELTK